MIPDRPLVLRGKALREFEKYENRTPTQEEINYVKSAQELYESSKPLEVPEEKLKRCGYCPCGRCSGEWSDMKKMTEHVLNLINCEF